MTEEDVECPTCGPVKLEQHPFYYVYRCCYCMEWLATGDGQLFAFPLSDLIQTRRVATHLGDSK